MNKVETVLTSAAIDSGAICVIAGLVAASSLADRSYFLGGLAVVISFVNMLNMFTRWTMAKAVGKAMSEAGTK